MEKITSIFKALSDTNRLRILKMLQVKPLCVCEITEVLGLAASTVSQHLTILKKDGFIVEWKEGKWVNYKLNHQPDDSQVASLLSLLNFIGSDDESIKRDKEAVKDIDRYTICSR